MAEVGMVVPEINHAKLENAALLCGSRPPF
jgi:hypothetical protein